MELEGNLFPREGKILSWRGFLRFFVSCILTQKIPFLGLYRHFSWVHHQQWSYQLSGQDTQVVLLKELLLARDILERKAMRKSSEIPPSLLSLWREHSHAAASMEDRRETHFKIFFLQIFPSIFIILLPYFIIHVLSRQIAMNCNHTN